MAPTKIEQAEEAREVGNKLYNSGHFMEAAKEYQKAVVLDPSDSKPLSNLSAANFEAGIYNESVDFTVKALALINPNSGTDVAKQRLFVRQARAYLHQSDLGGAEEFIAKVEPGKDHDSLHDFLKEMRKFRAFPSQPKLVREALLQLPRLRPSLQDEPKYWGGPSHDEAESVYTTTLKKSTAKDPVLSLMFCGIGDARNLFQTFVQFDASSPKKQKLHVTMLDHKSTIIARDLIFFSLLHEASVDVESKDMILLSLTYIYCLQILPPYVWDKLQETIRKLVDILEQKKQPLSFAFIRVSQMDMVIRALKGWQYGPATEYETSEIRSTIVKNWDKVLNKLYPECREDYEMYRKFGVAFPSTDALSAFEPELSAIVTEYLGSRSRKRLEGYLDKHWKVNATYVDADWEAKHKKFTTSFVNERFQVPQVKPPNFTEDLFYTVQQLNWQYPKSSAADSGSPFNILNHVVKFFQGASSSLFALRDRLTIEVMVGDMIDTLERLRYGHLDRYPQDEVVGDQESMSNTTEWPQKYHVIHESNIPDYTGGSLTSFLYATPVLREGKGTGVTSCVLANPPKWKNIDHLNAEYLLMHNHAAIEKHFRVKLGNDNPVNTLPLQGRRVYDTTYYHRWEACLNGPSPLKQLMSRSNLTRWMFAHFLKMCLPCPRLGGIVVYAPNNLTVFLRLLVQMAEVGYPGHWLSSIVTSLCSGSITTAARAPQQDALDQAAADAVYSSRTMNVKAWVAEFTTLVTMWRSVLPFSVVAPSGTLPSPDIINEYSIRFPTHSKLAVRMPTDDIPVPNFVLIFIHGMKYGNYLESPYYILLDDERGDTTTMGRKIKSDGLVVVSAFKWTTEKRTATFWLRSDVMDKMVKEDWTLAVWRVDTWGRCSPSPRWGRDFVLNRTWKECVTSS